MTAPSGRQALGKAAPADAEPFDFRSYCQRLKLFAWLGPVAEAVLGPRLRAPGVAPSKPDDTTQRRLRVDAAALRARQAPIKERCRNEPTAAVVTLKARGTLGVARDAPVGFRRIRLRFDLDTEAPQDRLEQLLKLTERYCVVYRTIAKGPPVDIALRRV
jgi:hypothetical protein